MCSSLFIWSKGRFRSVPSRHGAHGVKDTRPIKGPSLKFYKWRFQLLPPSQKGRGEEKGNSLFPQDGLLEQCKTEEMPMHANHVQQQNEVTMERGRAKWQIAGLKVWIPGHLKPDPSIFSYLVTWDYSFPFIQLQPRILIKTAEAKCYLGHGVLKFFNLPAHICVYIVWECIAASQMRGPSVLGSNYNSSTQLLVWLLEGYLISFEQSFLSAKWKEWHPDLRLYRKCLFQCPQ